MTGLESMIIDLVNKIIPMLPILITGIGGSTVTFLSAKYAKSIKRRKGIKENYLHLHKKAPDVDLGRKMKAFFSKKDNENYLDILNKANIPEVLKSIVETFKAYASPEDLKLCAENLKSININHKNILTDLKDYIRNVINPVSAAGTYSPNDNDINIYIDSNNILSHEFLHMASTSTYNVGFQVYPNSIEVGRGLNEGYTELLNHRIFHPNDKRVAYRKNVKITRLLETFFDNPKDFEHAYFTGDIDKVFEAFCKYGTYDELLGVLQNLDNFAHAPIPKKDNIDYIKLQLKLYKIIKRSQNDDKIKNFENILKEDKIMKILTERKLKLSSQKFYTSNLPQKER